MRSFPTFLAATLVAGACGFAQEPPKSIEDELLAILNTPIESASKRVQFAIESPQAVEVITADQIKASGAFRLVDILRLATSVHVWDEDPTRANVSIRGVNPGDNPRTMQLLVDGVALYNLQASPLDFNGLPVPVDAIERVEIVRGPSSSLYGANAQMGVIAITTKRAKSGYAGSFRAAGTDHSGARGQAFFAMGIQDFSLILSGAGLSNKDRGLDQKVIGFPELAYRADDSSQEKQLYVRPEVKLGDARIWLVYGHGEWGPFTETTATQPVLGANNTMARQVTFPEQRVVRGIAQLGWAQTWSPTFKSEVRLNQKDFRIPIGPANADTGMPVILNLLLGIDPAFARSRDFYADRVQELAFQANWDPSATLHVVFGADTKRIWSGTNLTVGLYGEQNLTATGGFVSVDWTTGPVTFSAGARAANESLGGASTSPRVSAVWKLSSDSVLRAGFYTSTRSPMVQEMFATIPNLPIVPTIQDASPDLKSEEVQTVEIGYRKKWVKWSLDMTYFEATLKKLIAQAPTGEIRQSKPVVRYTNGSATVKDRGLELSLVGEVASGWFLGLNASTADFKDPIYGLDQQADYTPKQTVNLWTRFKKDRFFAYGALQSIGSWTAVSSYRTTSATTTFLRTTVDALLQAHFNVGMEVHPGVSLSAYGINALKKDAKGGVNGLANQFLFRNVRQEFGLQAAWRF